MVHVPVVSTLWIVVPIYVIVVAYFTSDIIGNVCIPWGVYSSVVAEKSLALLIVFIGYPLPLALVIFCYSRIVYALRTKVTTRHHDPFEFFIANCEHHVPTF